MLASGPIVPPLDCAMSMDASLSVPAVPAVVLSEGAPCEDGTVCETLWSDASGGYCSTPTVTPAPEAPSSGSAAAPEGAQSGAPNAAPEGVPEGVQ